MALPKPSTSSTGTYYTVYYYCWNTTTLAPVTGDANNHTVRISKDGGSPTTTTNSPSEVSSAYFPGWYKIDLTQTEYQANSLLVGATSSTTGTACTVAAFYTDRGHLVPIKAQTDKLTFSDGNYVYATAPEGVVLTSSEHDAIQGDVVTALSDQGYTVARAAKLDNLDAAVSSRSTLTTGGVMTALDAQGYTTGRAGKLDNLDASVSGVPSGVWEYSSRGLTESVTVGGYVSGASPADLILSEPSYKLATDEFGNVFLADDDHQLIQNNVVVGLETLGYTSGRATKLDNLDASVSGIPSGVWNYTTRTLSSFGSLASDVAAAVWSYTVEASQSALAWMRLIGSVLFGKRTASSGSVAYRDWNDSKNRIVASEDREGNRSITSRDGS